MNKARTFVAMLLAISAAAAAAESGIPRFAFEPSAIELRRLAQPASYFDKVGRRFAILGAESGTFEAWAYPLKLVRNCEFLFFIGSSTQPILARDIVRSIAVTPEATTLTFVFQSFTVRATYVAAVEEPGAVILLAVDSTEPLTIVCSFLPVLQPMWPAGIGGQYASWDGKLRAYIISEPTRSNHGLIGSPAAQGISYTPAHMLSDVPNQFKITVDNPAAATSVYFPVILAGGKGKREDVRRAYEKLAADPEAVYRAALDHYRALRAGTLRVKTPVRDFDLAFEWAKVAYDNLFVNNPDLGRGLVAGLGSSGAGGRPGFGWFFGGDAYMNSLSLDAAGAFDTVRDALLFTQKWQREDGKMAHELSQAASYVNWFKDYPYAYIHGDTTPFYIVACGDYLRCSGDVEFVRRSWPSIEKAFEWCLTTDADDDGLMDNRSAGLGALEFGSLTGIQTDIYLAAAWARACFAMERMAGAVGDSSARAKARGAFEKARAALDAKFWDAEKGQYTYAFSADGRLVKELTPWSAVPLVWELGDRSRSLQTLEKLNAADMTTDWGVRMMSCDSRYFEPLNYNYGAVWPFLTGWVATALYRHDDSVQGYGLLRAAVRHTFDNALGDVTELFSGAQNIWPQEGVAHQGFSSSGVIFPFVRGLLGLEGDALRTEILVAPRLPADWPETAVENYRLGNERFNLTFERTRTRLRLQVSRAGIEPWTMVYEPALGLGTRIKAARLDGRAVPVRLNASDRAQAVRPRIEFLLARANTIELDIEPAVDILAPENPSATGDPNRGLRLIRQELAGGRLNLTVEGLSGRTYFLPLLDAGRVRSISGGAIEGSAVKIAFGGETPGAYARAEITLVLK
jgi:glycogen debranching enzyme